MQSDAARPQNPQALLHEQIHARLASRWDVNGIVALIELAYRGSGAGRWDSEAHLLTGPRTSHGEVKALVGDPDSRFVLLTRRDDIVGCALVQRRGATSCSAADGATGAYFGMFAIDPAVRGEGLGDRLLAECEARVQSLWGAVAMVMTVINVREELIHWYGRRGYLPTGARIPFPFTETTGETTRDFDLIELRKPFSAAG